MPYLKPVLAGLLASAIVYLCFLTWLHWKVVSLVKEQGSTGLIAVTGAQVYVLHSPSLLSDLTAVVTGVGIWVQLPSSWPQWYTEETANPMTPSVTPGCRYLGGIRAR